MDEESRDLKKQWKSEQKAEAQAAFPLSDEALEALFSAVEGGVADGGCDHTLRHTRAWLEVHETDAEATIEWLNDNGGYCDCEVAGNAFDHWQQNRR